MPTIHTSITIPAPPSVVREVFLDWKNYEWSKTFLNKIEIQGEKTKTPADLEDGDGLKITNPDMSFESTVQINSPHKFQWRGSGLLGAFVGEHRFEFLPEDGDVNQTLFVQIEEFTGLLSFLVGPTWSMGKSTQKGFEGFNHDLKDEVVRRQSASAGAGA